MDTGSNHVYGGDYTAAICAVNRGTIANCTSKGYLYGYADQAFAGGIAAVNFGTIENCLNQAVVGAVGADVCSGGIAGVSAQGTVTNCTNQGGVSTQDSGQEATELCLGGVVGLNYKSTIDRCTNTADLLGSSENGYSGGVAGLNNGVVRNSLNQGSLTGDGRVGGVTGYLFTNQDTQITAQVASSLDLGGNVVYGDNQGGTASNNFYKAAASGEGSAGQTSVTQEQLGTGEVAYRLNGNNTQDPVWGQQLGTDPAPVLGSTYVVYAKYQEGAIVGYTNSQEDSHTHTFDQTGKCTVEGCGYQSVKLGGWTLTLDGALGVTFYYDIDPMYLEQGYNVAVTFTLDGKKTTVPLDQEYCRTGETGTEYGFRLYVNSDKATHDIVPVMEIQKEGQTVVSLAQDSPYRIYDYLKRIINNQDDFSPELVQLAKALATYDY